MTKTGRHSSKGPNFQNLPIRTDMGGRIREAMMRSTPEYQPHPGPSRPEWWSESADYVGPVVETYPRQGTLRAIRADRARHQTCGYWYLVHDGAMSHTAFRTRSGLDRWLSERGLRLDGELSDHVLFPDDYGVVEIIGKYRDVVYNSRAEYDAASWLMKTRKASNGEYTEAKLQEVDGVSEVRYCNVNVAGRLVFDHEESRRILEGLPRE